MTIHNFSSYFANKQIYKSITSFGGGKKSDLWVMSLKTEFKVRILRKNSELACISNTFLTGGLAVMLLPSLLHLCISTRNKMYIHTASSQKQCAYKWFRNVYCRQFYCRTILQQTFTHQSDRYSSLLRFTDQMRKSIWRSAGVNYRPCVDKAFSPMFTGPPFINLFFQYAPQHFCGRVEI